MSKIAYTLAWSTSAQAYTIVSGSQHSETLPFVPGSSAWFAWLAETSSFAFHGQSGSYTARQEAVRHGERYWYAYLRNSQKVRKKYLGKTADLTIARLEQVAESLHANLAPAISSATTPVRQPQASSPSSTAIRPAASTAVLPVKVAEEVQAEQADPQSNPFAPLLSIRLHAPRPPARLVPRSRLLERLKQGLSQKLTLICAPAGFGKTTLLAEFLAERQLPVAWLSLDAEDNDPLRFLAAVLAAFDRYDPAMGKNARVLLSSPGGLSLPAVFALLINEITSRDRGDLLLILDDYHLISAAPIQQALAYLVEHCPPQLHLVLSTRADPPLPLARLRARGQLCELRAIDLQFDATEARHFLHMALGRDLESSALATILTRTEGWVAGLQLTALSLQTRRTEAEVLQFLANSLDSHRHLVDYLVEEVLVQQPEAVQAFLLQTSLLEPLSTSLCAVVTETSQDESAAMLTYLERANLFLFPLDERGEWYRYHPLWASILRVRLEQQIGPEGIAVLYERASRWYEQHDLPSEATETALAAGEFERAAQLIEQLGANLLVRGHYTGVRRWIERLPSDQWETRPILCLTYAWSLFISGQLSAYEVPLEKAEQLFAHEGSNVGMGLAATLRALAAALLNKGLEALTSGREALALLPATQLVSRTISMSAVGSGYWLAGEVEAAAKVFVEARTVHEQAGNVGGLLADQLILGQVLILQGKLHAAAATYQRMIEEAAERRGYAIEAMIHRAAILYEWNMCKEAEAELTRVLDESRETDDHVLLARGGLTVAYIIQGRLRQIRGEYEAAHTLFTQAMTLAEQSHLPRNLARARAAQVSSWLAQGQIEAVKRWGEAWTERWEATPTYEEERDALTLARMQIALDEPAEALHMLDNFRTLARKQGRLGSELEILALSALALNAQGKTGQALHTLQQALALAEPEGYVRLFVDEGLPMAGLLHLALSREKGQHRVAYVRQLLTVLQAEHPEQADSLSSLLQPLSGRERTILHLLAAGRSTTQIAAELVVSPNTIKTQVSSLYRKLGVHSREEAIFEATHLRLL